MFELRFSTAPQVESLGRARLPQQLEPLFRFAFLLKVVWMTENGMVSENATKF